MKIIFFEISNSRGDVYISTTIKPADEILEIYKNKYELYLNNLKGYEKIFDLMDIPIKLKILLVLK